MRIFGVAWAFLGAVLLLWMVKTLGHPPDTRGMLWMPFACFLGWLFVSLMYLSWSKRNR